MRYLEHQSAAGRPDPLLNCKLAEALLHRRRCEDALACARRGFLEVGSDPALLGICAWVFSNCGSYGEAADAYRRLVELSPDWIEGHRHLSGALAAAGRVDEAIASATTAAILAPDNPEFALHAAALLSDRGRVDEAAEWAMRAVAAVQGGELGAVIDAAEVLMRCGRAEDAASLLRGASAEAATSRLWRVLSGAEMLCGRLDGALDAAKRARGAEPDNAEFALHHGHLLWRRGDMSEAALAFAGAAQLDPGGRDVKRTQLSFYLAAGLTTEATVAGGELLHRFPDDQDAAEAVLHLLNHRLDTIDGQYVVLGERTVRAPRPPRPQPGLLERLRSQRRVVRALIIRETRTRFADTRLGYGWALIEPMLHIALLSATFAVLMHGRPPIGPDFFIFYYTGLIPYHVFVHASTGMSHALINNAPLLQLPPVSSFDCHRRARPSGNHDGRGRRHGAAGGVSGDRAAGDAGRFVGAVDSVAGDRRFRIRNGFCQRGGDGLLAIVGKGLRATDPAVVFRLRHFPVLCSKRHQHVVSGGALFYCSIVISFQRSNLSYRFLGFVHSAI